MTDESRIAVVTITDSGAATARVLAHALRTLRTFREIDHLDHLEHRRAEKRADPAGETGMERGHNKTGLAALTSDAWDRYEGLIFIMATGIVVRMIAPLITDKYHDPAVVVVDDARRFSISLLSGHEGGANRLAWDVASALGSIPVITTATETNRRLTIGIGCRRGVTSEEVRQAVLQTVDEAGIALEDVRTAATIDLKRGEQGLVEGVRSLGLPLLYFSANSINGYGGEFASSAAAARQLDVKAVAEPCALLAAGVAGMPAGSVGSIGADPGGKGARLLLPKTVSAGRKVTIAIALETGEEI
jgi:cobalamin biosynthesis protein CbiG